MTVPKALEEGLKQMPDGWILLLETAPEHTLEIGIAINSILTKKGYTGVILAASRPYSNILSLYGKNDIDTSKLMIIDCLSKGQNGASSQGNVLFVDSAGALTQISLSIVEALSSINGKKYLYIDSLATMLIHNQANAFTSFIHSLLTKLRLNDTNGLMLSISKGLDAEIRNEIAQLCDQVLSV